MSTTEKPDPVRAALFAAQLVTDAEAKRLVGLSDEEFLAEQKRKGRDLSRTPSAEEFLERVKALAALQELATPATQGTQEPATPTQATQAPATTTAQATQVPTRDAPVLAMPRPRVRQQRLMALLAAAFGVGLVVFVATRPDNPAEFHPDPTPREQAEQLRDAAIGSCAAGVWIVCKHRLDDAAKLDPAGESEPRVQKARADIANAEHPGPKGTENPGK